MAATVSARIAPRTQTPWARRWSYTQDAALVGVSVLFFYAHARTAFETGSFRNVFFAIEQGLLIGMFLTRRRSQYTSTRPMDWVVATVGGWLPLAVRPHDTGASAELLGAGIQVVGLTAVIVSFATLGKSFGVVAANRGLKVGGPYRLVRHPIYVAHAVTLTGFLVANFGWYNLTIYSVSLIFQLFRIAAEERVLVATTEYASYRERVRWRLVPRLY